MVNSSYPGVFYFFAQERNQESTAIDRIQQPQWRRDRKNVGLLLLFLRLPIPLREKNKHDVGMACPSFCNLSTSRPSTCLTA